MEILKCLACTAPILEDATTCDYCGTNYAKKPLKKKVELSVVKLGKWSKRTVKMNNSTFSGNNVHVIGNNNKVSGNDIDVSGNNNKVTGYSCTVHGNNNILIGNNNSILGGNNNQMK